MALSTYGNDNQNDLVNRFATLGADRSVIVIECIFCHSLRTVHEPFRRTVHKTVLAVITIDTPAGAGELRWFVSPT